MMPEERQRLVKAALDKFKYRPTAMSPTDVLLQKAQAVTEEVRRVVQPVLTAGGAKDRSALIDLISRQYLERFDRFFEKEELCDLCVMLHTQLMLETIDQDPLGSGAPSKIEPK